MTEHSAERWGGAAYKIKPRKPSVTTLSGYWSSDGSIQLTGAVTQATCGTAHIRLAFADLAAEWQPASIHANGTFTLTSQAPSGVFELDTMAL